MVCIFGIVFYKSDVVYDNLLCFLQQTLLKLNCQKLSVKHTHLKFPLNFFNYEVKWNEIMQSDNFSWNSF